MTPVSTWHHEGVVHKKIDIAKTHTRRPAVDRV
jgi:hypothetical protein